MAGDCLARWGRFRATSSLFLLPSPCQRPGLVADGRPLRETGQPPRRCNQPPPKESSGKRCCPAPHLQPLLSISPRPPCFPPPSHPFQNPDLVPSLPDSESPPRGVWNLACGQPESPGKFWSKDMNQSLLVMLLAAISHEGNGLQTP